METLQRQIDYQTEQIVTLSKIAVQASNHSMNNAVSIKLLAIGYGLLILCFFLHGCSQESHAQTFIYDDPCVNSIGWDCYNASQGSPLHERVEYVLDARLVLPKGTTLYLIDPIRENKDTWSYGYKVKGKKAYVAIMGGCKQKSIKWLRLAVRALKQHKNVQLGL